MPTLKPVLITSVLILAMMIVPTAHAVVIYDFVGACTLTCTGKATGVLTLVDSYVPGTALLGTDIVSFSFNSDAGPPYMINSPGVSDPSSLPISAGQSELVLDLGVDDSFRTGVAPDSNGRLWQIQAFGTGCSGGGGSPCGGDDYTWTLRPIPVPSAMLLMGSGLLGLIGWRKWSTRNR